jgi:(1->4)-alpha-D-glucan 1-alpha-D-glucosylmutase
MIIGEDLGTVPAEVRAALNSINVLSYRILYFEKNWREGSFKSPSDFPRDAVAMVGSHDLPTLSGFWHETDLVLCENLGLFPSTQFRDKQRKARAQDRIEIVAALERENLISPREINGEEIVDDLSTELILGVHCYLARSKAILMLVQLEDLFGQMNQINMPGTIDQHPNWRRKLPVNIEDWLDQGNLAFFAQAIIREREALDRK